MAKLTSAVGALLKALALIALVKHFRPGVFGSRNPAFVLAAVTASLAVVLQLTSRENEESKLIPTPSTVGRLVTDDLDFDEFDVIIVGGGTAGCVLASRLTEDPNIRVLVLEAGTSGKALLWSRIPTTYGMLFRGKHVHDLLTEPQLFTTGKRIYWPRAKLLGGCSSINAQMAQYGAPEDFDEWANIIGDQSWSWKEFSQYFRKFEKFVPDPKYPEVTGKGTSGPVQVGYFTYISETSTNFVKACTNVGIPLSVDFTGNKGTLGVNRTMTYVDKNVTRVSTEAAYLTDDVLSRPNLKVAIHAQVTKVLFETIGGETRAVAVEFSRSKHGPRYRARARKEVIVAAGAVHTPQILMLSGVGPAEQLAKFNIPLVKDLPGVGAHLVDHPVVDLNFKDRLNKSSRYMKPTRPMDIFRMLYATMLYAIKRTGPLASNVAESTAFLRSDDPAFFPPAEFPEKMEDSTSGPGSPDLEIFSTPVAYKEQRVTSFPYDTAGIHICLLRPTSTGEVLLNSSDPWDHPRLNPNYCQTQHDVDVLLRGVKFAMKISKTEPLASQLDHSDKRSEVDHELYKRSDDELRTVVKERVETLYHPTSTCRMAPLEDKGVVDSKLRVYGIKGLRVCDASIYAKIISGHTAGACIAAGEKLSDVIKAELQTVAGGKQ